MAPEAKSPFVHPVGGGKKVSLADLIVLAGCAGPGVAGAAGARAPAAFSLAGIRRIQEYYRENRNIGEGAFLCGDLEMDPLQTPD